MGKIQSVKAARKLGNAIYYSLLRVRLQRPWRQRGQRRGGSGLR